MEIAFKLDGELYEVDRITLNDALLIDREFGVQNIAEFDWTRPAYLAALVYIGIRDKNRLLSHDQIMLKVGAVDLVELADSVMEAVQEKAAAEADPPKAAGAAGGKPKRKPTGKPA